MANKQIQWYPGHMTKAKREMQEKLKMVDMVIELRDARIPNASKNPMIATLCAHKPRLLILSKKDKADPIATNAWIKALHSETTCVLALDIQNDAIIEPVVDAARKLMKVMLDRMLRKGMRPRAIRAMVVGVPNVGKSTFINRIAKKKVAITGDRPGITRSLQWAHVHRDLDLLDTPGVLWPKFEDPQVGVLLAITGAIRDEILPLEDVAVWGMHYLIVHGKDALIKRYDVEVVKDPYAMLDAIARKRGFLRHHNDVDRKRTIETFLRELRDERLGRITWEMPYEDDE